MTPGYMTANVKEAVQDAYEVDVQDISYLLAWVSSAPFFKQSYMGKTSMNVPQLSIIIFTICSKICSALVS